MESVRIDNVVYGPKTDTKFSRSGLGVFLFESAKKYAEKTCQVCVKTGIEETFEQVNRRTVYAALEMRKRGVTRSDVVALCAANCLDCVAALGATFYLGAKFSPLDSNLSTDIIVSLLNMVKPKIIFVGPESVKVITAAAKEITFTMEIVVFGDESFGFTPFTEFQHPQINADNFTPVEIADDRETAFIIFSSGTSGAVKGICVSHYAMLKYAESDMFLGWNSDCIMDSASLYWTVGIALLIEGFWAGGNRVLWDKYESDLAAKMIQDYKVTIAFINASAMYHFTEENTLKYDTSSLHTIQSGGSSLTTDQLLKVRKYFPHSIVALGYGMTEAGVITSFSRVHDLESMRKKPGSCGKVVPNMKLKVVNLQNEEKLGPNKVGEIRIKGEAMFNGYYNVNTADYFDASGWFRTGDIGYYDDDNCVYICDRLKEVFKFQDWHVFPTVIEKILYQHPQVKETIVIGVPRVPDGEHPLALVVPTEKCTVTADDILKFVNSRVMDYEKLRAGVVFMENLPKTPSGKIKRKAIRDMYLKGELEKLS